MQFKNATDFAYVSAATPLPVSLTGTIPATITDDTTTNATMYPVWVTAATGNLPLKVTSTKFSWNPSTGALTITGPFSAGAGSFSTGTFSGDVTLTNVTSIFTLGNAASDGLPSIRFLGSNSAKNWEIAHQKHVTGASLEFTPSTVGGGSTFTTPVMTLIASGCSVNGTLSTDGGLQTFGANDSGGAGYRLVLVPNA